MKKIQMIKKLITTLLLSLAAMPFAYGMDRLTSTPPRHPVTQENVSGFIKRQRQNPESFFSIAPKDVTDMIAKRTADQIEYEKFMFYHEHESPQEILSILCQRGQNAHNLILDNEDVVVQLICSGAQVNHRDNQGLRPLQQAAKYGHLKMCQWLIKHHAQIDFTVGLTPLILAIVFDREDIVAFLIEKGANINLASNFWWTPLIWAVHKRNARIIKKLIEAGADINHKDTFGTTPLIHAVIERFENITHSLIEANAGVDLQDSHGKTALTYAADQGWDDMVKYLLSKRARVNIQDYFGSTPLTYAAINEYKETVLELFKAGARTSPTLELEYALRSPEISQSLIRNGCNSKIIHLIGFVQMNPKKTILLICTILAIVSYLRYA